MPSDPNHKDSAIAHFHDKLLHIRERLKTAPGRKMGEKRHQFVRPSQSCLFISLLHIPCSDAEFLRIS
jgi:hypothetical protein